MTDKADVILIAKSAIAAAPVAELGALADALVAANAAAHATFAFTEQGKPALRERLIERIDAGAAQIILVPLIVPMEPSFMVWIAKARARWAAADGREWPEIRIAPPPLAMAQAATLVADAVSGAKDWPQPPVPTLKAEGSIVPQQKRRVLVCHGAPCMAAGAPLVWGHLRNEQLRQSLRTSGEGMMSAKSTCLGPCNLAPVVQVWPENTTYGGVDEAGIDAIIERHILRGLIADDYAYPADGRKQRLRGAGSQTFPVPSASQAGTNPQR